MNINSKILTVLIFSGLFFVNKKHLEQRQTIIIPVFIGLIILLTFVSNYNKTVNEKLTISRNGQYELQVVTNENPHPLFLNIIHKSNNKNNSCKNDEKCNDVTAINTASHNQNKVLWKFEETTLGGTASYTKYDIIYKDSDNVKKYLTYTDNNFDCIKSTGVDSDNCYDVILETPNPQKVHWEVRAKANSDYYQIICHRSQSTMGLM